MKPKELLYSLDHVGDDLLAQAEQTVLVRKHRPWAGAAAAAVVLVALGVWGFFLWKNLKGGLNPAATGTPSDPAVTRPRADPIITDTMELPLLTVGDSWTGLSRARFDNLDASLAGSLASEYDLSANSWNLPVYLLEGWLNGGAGLADSTEALVNRLYQAAARIGVSADDGYDCTFEDAGDGTMYAASCSCETDQGTLTVYADGRIRMLYNTKFSYEARVKIDLTQAVPIEELRQSWRDACMQECGEELADRLDLGDCGFVPCDHWDPTSSAWTVYTIYPLRKDPKEQLIARWFETVRMLTNDGQTLRGFELDRLPGEAGAAVPEGLWLQGSYPVQTAVRAADALLHGDYYCEEPVDEARIRALRHSEDSLETLCQSAVLVYQTGYGHGQLMPFYRFWLPADEDGESGEYLALYVPAIHEFYLRDWSVSLDRHPTLTLGEIGKDRTALLLTDPAAYCASGPLQEDQLLNLLPVYEMPEESVSQAILYLFAEGDRYTPASGASLQGSERNEALLRAFTDRVVSAVGFNANVNWTVLAGSYPQARTFPGVEEPLYPADIYANPEGFYSAAPFVDYSLGRITLWYRDGTLWGFSVPELTLANSDLFEYLYGRSGPEGTNSEPYSSFVIDTGRCDTPVGVSGTLTEIGSYPAISPAEARTLAWAGSYAGASTKRPEGCGELLDLPVAYQSQDELLMDLVYLPNEAGQCLIPFYRFFCPVGQDTVSGATLCELRYVPAINALYLEDYPAQVEVTEDPGESTEEPTETSPDPTEPPDGYQPMPVLRSNGEYEIAGPAGAVQALHYMGPACQDPVWADLDGDGFRELIYWCNGPTSGVFTVGICVYGLDEGWPVLEASGIYVLSYGEISLSKQNGSVFFHHTPWSYVADPDAEGGVSAVPGTERILNLTLRDGTILLNGSTSPDGEGVSQWGSPEYGWFGSSFNRLKAEVRDRCVFNHWACLVWTEPSAASAPTAGPRVFAAVTDNSHTVTGLLRYVPNQDGTWTCLMRGIEPIKAPADPEALMGLTPEQVTERLGPCHFDMGSGLYIPCWFTEDCRMLMVHIQGVVDRVELRDLTALDD